MGRASINERWVWFHVPPCATSPATLMIAVVHYGAHAMDKDAETRARQTAEAALLFTYSWGGPIRAGFLFAFGAWLLSVVVTLVLAVLILITGIDVVGLLERLLGTK